MRWFHLAVIGFFAIVTAVFALQNLGQVTISFLGTNARAPLALVVVIIYILGAFTGGSLLALLRKSYAGAKNISN
mgnify:CR=1 FL=1